MPEPLALHGGGIDTDGPELEWRYRATVQVIVNGDELDLPDGATVTDLLDRLNLGGKWVLVERNGEPVARAELAATVLGDGDRLELVRAVAGG